MIVAVDAGAVLKWLFSDPSNEPNTDSATRLMEAIASETNPVQQPPHWFAEVAGVLAWVTAAGYMATHHGLRYPRDLFG